MMGPAFIKLAESASPQASITPGNVRPITARAGSARRSGNTPVGSRLARTVMAASNGALLRVSQGSVPVSAKATSARLPAAYAALANTTEPKVPGGRNTTWPAARWGASRAAISECAVAGVGQTMSSAPRTASAMSVVIRSGRVRCRPRKSSIMMWPPAARCAATAEPSRRHRRTSCPASARSPAAANAPLPPPSTATRMLAWLRVARGRLRRGCGRILEAEMLHLTHGIAWQAVDPKIGARNLVAGELRFAKAFDFRHIVGRARPRNQVGDRHLLPFRIWAADNGGVRDGGMLVENPFDLGWIDVLAAGDDQVVFAIVNKEVPVRVTASNVAGMKPALAQCIARGGAIAPIFHERAGAAHDHLTRRSHGQLVATLIDDANLAAEPRQSGRSRPLPVARKPGIDRDRAGLGRAIDLQHGHAAPGKGIDQALRHLRRAGGYRPQTGERRLGPGGILKQGLDGGGHQHDQGRPHLGNCGQGGLSRETRQQGDAGTELQGRRRLDIKATDMEQRQYRQDVIRRRHIVHVLAHDGIPQQRLLTQHGAFRTPGRARGVDDQQRRAVVNATVATIAAAGGDQRGQRSARRGCEIDADNW